MDNENKNWINEMVERQALPEPLREGTIEEWCKERGVAVSTYYYYASKPENQKRIITLSINNAKKHAPDVLENLGKRAKENKGDAELYLKFILQLADRMDVTSDGKKIGLEREKEINTLLDGIIKANKENNNIGDERGEEESV